VLIVEYEPKIDQFDDDVVVFEQMHTVAFVFVLEQQFQHLIHLLTQ